MTQDPKKLPSWLTGGDKKPKNEPPPAPEASKPNSGSDDASADIPPWLREDLPPPSRVKRVAPPPPQEQQGEGDLPPWLAGADQPAQPKSYKIGGVELSEEYLSGGDALPETLDSEMTFDSWMADQVESNREKDIEEEVPDDLMSSIQQDAAAPKQTGQLPDWFLGLESLDTEEAPEWFVADDDAPPQPAEPATPTWISDMIDEERNPAAQSEAEDELPSADEIGSFFTTIGSVSRQSEDETPDIDWYDQVDTPDEQLDTPSDDFFAQLVGKNTASSSAPPPYTPQSNYDSFADFDAYGEDEEPERAPAAPEPQASVEIPQNELDAFFDNI
ncbi:MAG: hypothetical protein ABI835_17220, partial [Chloroflexota bacterium]